MGMGNQPKPCRNNAKKDGCQKDNCTFLHSFCKFDLKCKKRDCMFKHTCGFPPGGVTEKQGNKGPHPKGKGGKDGKGQKEPQEETKSSA